MLANAVMAPLNTSDTRIRTGIMQADGMGTSGWPTPAGAEQSSVGMVDSMMMQSVPQILSNEQSIMQGGTGVATLGAPSADQSMVNIQCEI